MTSAGVGPAIAIGAVLKLFPGMEQIAADFQNKHATRTTGELRGVGDAAGRALLRLATLYEYWVAAQLVGHWKEDGPRGLRFERKVCGLCFDKTKRDEDYCTVLLHFVDKHGKPQVFQLVLEEIKAILDEEGNVVNGAPLQMLQIERALQTLVDHQAMLHAVGLLDIPDEKTLRWHDIQFAGTDHAGELLIFRTSRRIPYPKSNNACALRSRSKHNHRFNLHT
jgi:hypothetical protein